MSQTIGQITQSSGNALRSDPVTDTWTGGKWWAQLLPGSWRGVGFVMDVAPTRAGRRLAIHEYPYRDTAWVEDLGKLPRRFQMQAFMVGDDVYSQRDRMVAACEQPGKGTLIHPTFGSAECVLLEFEVADHRERGRVVTLSFSFIVADDLRYPDSSTATGDHVAQSADDVDGAARQDLRGVDFPANNPFETTTTVPVYARTRSTSRAVTQEAAGEVIGFTELAVSAVNDATRALNAVRGLSGFYGRYAGGKRLTILPSGATVATALAASTTARFAVIEAADAVNAAAGNL